MKNQTTVARASKHDTTALALLGAMFIVLAIVGGASLSAAGTGALQKVVSVIGFGNTSAIETEQRRQAEVLATLEPIVHSVSTEVNVINKRLVKGSDHDNATVNDRFAVVDADIAALVAEIKSLRQARTADWANPVGQLDTSIVALRSSFDEHQQAYRKDIGGINKRLDRLEQFMARDLTGSIHLTARKKPVRRRAPQIRTPGPAAAAGPSAPQTMFGVASY